MLHFQCSCSDGWFYCEPQQQQQLLFSAPPLTLLKWVVMDCWGETP